MHPPCPRVWCALGLGLGLGLGFEKFENINHCLRTYFKVPSNNELLIQRSYTLAA